MEIFSISLLCKATTNSPCSMLMQGIFRSVDSGFSSVKCNGSQQESQYHAFLPWVVRFTLSPLELPQPLSWRKQDSIVLFELKMYMIPFHCASPLYNHMIQASRGASSAVYVTDFKTPKLPKINQMLAFPIFMCRTLLYHETAP